MTEFPRTRYRTRHSNSDASKPVKSQARSMDDGVSLLSNLLVTRKIGIRIMDGNRPK
jgi:hypothetical protein